MMTRMTNLFADLPESLSDELFEELVVHKSFKLERIVSTGHVTVPGEWCDQDRDEWVVLLRGAARLRFEADNRMEELRPGDYVQIPAHCRHRVEWTTPDQPTVWLALHFDP